MKVNSEDILVRSYTGKLYKVTAIFHNTKAANKYLENHKDEGVIVYCKPYIFIANLYDKI